MNPNLAYDVVDKDPVSNTPGVVTRPLFPSAGVPVFPVEVTTVTPSSTAQNASSVTIISANASRKFASIYNQSPVKLFIQLGAAASLTSFYDVIPPGWGWILDINYKGDIRGIWECAGNGNARASEGT